jgi:hypothetical protein
MQKSLSNLLGLCFAPLKSPAEVAPRLYGGHLAPEFPLESSRLVFTALYSLRSPSCFTTGPSSEKKS